MQLICPECLARYRVSSSALGESGRDVRCVKCSHEWFEVPENLENDIEDEVSAVQLDDIPVDNSGDNFGDSLGDERGDEFEDNSIEAPTEAVEEQEVAPNFDEVDDGANDPFALGGEINTQEDGQEGAVKSEGEDIPESVKPIEEPSNVPAFVQDVEKPEAGLQAKLMGYIAALLIFGGLIAGAVIFKQSIVSAWMPSAAIYELAGFPVKFQGQHLVMENLTAKAKQDVDGKKYLLLQGRVINLTNEVQDVPPLMARLRSTNGEDGKAWSIDTPLQKLEPGESFTFNSDYPALPDGSGSVNLSFKPTLKR